MNLFRQLRFQILPPTKRHFHSEGGKLVQKLIGPWDLMTGIERWQNLQYAKGNIDPFLMLPVKRGPGTKDCPNIIRSTQKRRIVGCICCDDSSSIKWWWLYEGYPRRCDCNHWFVLERFEPPPMYEDSVC